MGTSFDNIILNHAALMLSVAYLNLWLLSQRVDFATCWPGAQSSGLKDRFHASLFLGIDQPRPGSPVGLNASPFGCLAVAECAPFDFFYQMHPLLYGRGVSLEADSGPLALLQKQRPFPERYAAGILPAKSAAKPG